MKDIRAGQVEESVCQATGHCPRTWVLGDDTTGVSLGVPWGTCSAHVQDKHLEGTKRGLGYIVPGPGLGHPGLCGSKSAPSTGGGLENLEEGPPTRLLGQT